VLNGFWKKEKKRRKNFISLSLSLLKKKVAHIPKNTTNLFIWESTKKYKIFKLFDFY